MREMGSTTRKGVRGHGWPLLEGFMDEVVARYRERLRKDAVHAEMLLSTRHAGRSPATTRGSAAWARQLSSQPGASQAH